MSMKNTAIHDSANENEPFMRGHHGTVLTTQQLSEKRHRQMMSGGSPIKSTASKNVSVTFTEKRHRRGKNMSGGNHASLFDNTSNERMPSVLKTPEAARVRPRNIMSTDQQRGYRGPPVNIGNGMGYVNYVNGVPVSIQLNERDLLASDGVHGRMLQKPVSNWQ
jgi:hypothetical protein